jgi:hypothetical protein
VKRRRLTSVLLTTDRSLADVVASRVLSLRPGSGDLTPLTGWRRWFSWP